LVGYGTLMRAVGPVLVAFALNACSESPAATTKPLQIAPTFAPARTAVHHWTAAERDTIREQLRVLFSQPATSGVAGVAVVADDGTSIVDLHGDRAMTPASTMKLLVGSSSLLTLGKDDRLATSFESLRAPGADGDLNDVWLVGGGDPVLVRDDLVRAVATLRRDGVKKIADLVVDVSAFDGPEQNPDWSADDDQYDYAAGTSALSLDWDVRKDVVDGGTVYRPVHDIPAYVGAVTKHLLESAGIDVDHLRFDPAPLAAMTLWQHRSPTIDELVTQMFLESDNHIAEQLLRALGADDGVGTTQSGARVERRVLGELGVPTTGLRIVDGSGLATQDRVSPMLLATLLTRVASLQIGPTFVRTLPRAGIEGTVRYHHLTDAAGRVRAKSGHIEGVNALAGYVQTRNHGRVAFAFIVNEPTDVDDDAVQHVYDLALDQIAQF
jgi:D-alanyl-D-alanine carboxypeptidase/D-alanyl-D-alanine-endopeptidase (penicillin-binding protein 4)